MYAIRSYYVHARIAAKNCPVVHMHMPGQLRVVGKDRAVTNMAIMGDMHVGHDPVVAADARNAGILSRTEVEGAEFRNNFV